MKKMTTVTGFMNINRDVADDSMPPAKQKLRRWVEGLFVSAFFGAFSGLAGLTIGFLSLSELIVPSTSLYTISTVLIGASFILFGLAAHCLDKTDAAEKAIRMEEYSQPRGPKDEERQSRRCK
jgi:hypothetical protein